MASGSGSAPAGDGIHLSPLLSLFMHYMLIHIHTVKGFTRVDPHLVDPKSIRFIIDDPASFSLQS
jgi:hypothetical protein